MGLKAAERSTKSRTETLFSSIGFSRLLTTCRRTVLVRYVQAALGWLESIVKLLSLRCPRKFCFFCFFFLARGFDDSSFEVGLCNTRSQ